MCRHFIQHRLSYHRLPIGHRSRFVHRGIEYGALSSNHRFGSYYHTGNPESLRHRREFLDNHRLSHGSIHLVQTIQDGFIVPRVMGKITGLNPAIILLSLSIWGSLMGMLGMIIALPLTTLMLSYYQRFIINRENIHKTESTDNQTKEINN